MHAILTKEFHFEAAHQLPNHRGKCARLHGHSYRLEVSVRGPIMPARGASDDGMVIDLDDIKQIVQTAVISQLDHYNLNDLIDGPTTAERIAHWIWDRLEAVSPSFGALLWRIRLWETATGHVEITRAERTSALVFPD
ncbi:MAG: 6-carboxytetrahydropterin synthase QueD [Herpetosiphonaceae bacterium]|nr:6-carboxytetrahydropterin synthase QueD [Herpetosiphonaceae bacterium]